MKSPTSAASTPVTNPGAGPRGGLVARLVVTRKHGGSLPYDLTKTGGINPPVFSLMMGLEMQDGAHAGPGVAAAVVVIIHRHGRAVFIVDRPGLVGASVAVDTTANIGGDM